MNGDYASTRYSKLTQINPGKRQEPAAGVGHGARGMQDVGQNGPENEVNPLIDNGFMYTTDGWARCTRSTRAVPARASSSGSPIPG